MSSKQRRKELEEQAESEYFACNAEYNRKAALTMWERIEEANINSDVKEILHMLAEKLGMESAA